MPINNLYSNPIVESRALAPNGIGIPNMRTLSVFGGKGANVLTSLQYVAINTGMLSTPPNYGLGLQGKSKSGTGSFNNNTDTFDLTNYPQLPYPGSNPAAPGFNQPNPTQVGTVAVNSGTTAVTGTETAFQTGASPVLVGDVLYDITNSTVIGTVSTVNSDTSITLTANSSETASGIQIRTGDSIGTQYRIFNSVPARYYLWDIEIFNPAIAGATGYKLGVAKCDFGPTVGAADVLGTNLNLSTAHNYGSAYHVLNNLSLLQLSSYPIWEQVGSYFSTEPSAVDLVLTSTVAPTASNLIMVRATWITPVD